MVFGVEVAVKALAAAAAGGGQALSAAEREQLAWEEKQFVAEMDLLMRVSHPNMCRLVGWWCTCRIRSV
jgi:hypothetical protein